MKKFAFMSFLLLILISFTLTQNYQTLGQEEGDGELIDPYQIKEGPDGHIYVSDNYDYYIKVFSPDGTYLRRMGGKGEGPGEIKRLGKFAFTADNKSLFFTEFWQGHRWISIFELSGKLKQTQNIKIDKNFAIWGCEALADGGFIFQVYYSTSYQPSQDYFFYKTPKSLTRFDAKGAPIKDILKREFITRISFVRSGADMAVPFVPGFYWTIFKGNRILFTEGLTTTINMLDTNGKLLAPIKTPLPKPKKVTKDDLDHWRKQKKEYFQAVPSRMAWYNRFGKVIEKYKKSIYEIIPNLDEMSATPDDHILLSLTGEENEPNQYWLIDEKGKQLAHVKVNAGGVSISKHFVFFRFTDEEDETSICFFKRQGSEVDDLLRLSQIQ